VRVTQKNRRDYVAYKRWFRRQPMFSFPSPTRDRKKTPLEAFSHWESTGEIISCKKPRNLVRAAAGKKSLNLQIKQWAEGVADLLFLPREFQEDYPWLPKWVWKSLSSQTKKMWAVRRRT